MGKRMMPQEGWGKPGHSDEAHYFVTTRSLCGKWALFSSTLQADPLKGHPNCEECMSKLEKREA